jgi:4-carboxymuconolactone decarboxylase
MRFYVLCAVLVGSLAAIASAQVPAGGLKLRGDRFTPLTYDQMTPEQKTLTDHILSGPRHSMDGPFNVLLRSPEVGEVAQQLGLQFRFHSSLPPKLNEFAIMLMARYYTIQFEFAAHHRLALQAGLSPAVGDAVAAGKRPASMAPDEEALYNFSMELLNTRKVSDATFQAVKDKFGERGVVDLIGVMGYYHMVSMLLSVDRYPLPEGAKPELTPAP